MSDHSRSQGCAQPDAADIDDLLRAAAAMRPSAAVEEQLLLRLHDEVTTDHAQLATADDPHPPVIELAAPTDHTRTWRTPTVAAAAAIVVVIGAALVLNRPEPATETNPAVRAPEAAAIVLIAIKIIAVSLVEFQRSPRLVDAKKRKTLYQIKPPAIDDPNGKTEVIATPGGGPNGLAIGPDGALYCTNNGGFQYHEIEGLLVPGHCPEDYDGGRVERIDIATGNCSQICVFGKPNRLPILL